MSFDILWSIIIPVFVALCSGVLSSYLWWILTRHIGFPTIEVDKNITLEKNGNKIVRIRNTHKKNDAYDIICYAEYIFSYNGHLFKSTLHPRAINFIKSSGEEEISVKFPIKEITNNDGSKEFISDAFYQSTDGKLYIKVVYQNKYGVRRIIPTTFVVEREIEKLPE